MRFIPTRIHGMLDYLTGILLMAFPWVLKPNYAPDGAASKAPAALGASIMLYSALTDYELGLVRKLPMSTHLILDALGGVAMAISPWLFGFAQKTRSPHVMIGLFEIGAALTTRTAPSYQRRGRA